LLLERSQVHAIIRQPTAIENIVVACQQPIAVAQIWATNMKRLRKKLIAAGHKRSPLASRAKVGHARET
jgi:hypothetical protein